MTPDEYLKARRQIARERRENAMKHISVWINRTDRRDHYSSGYRPGDPLEKALTFEAEGDPGDLVEATFSVLNRPNVQGLGTLTVMQVYEYHNEFPSLSVGDVVEIDGSWFKVESVGHETIDPPVWVDQCEQCDEKRIVRPIGRWLLCADCAQGDYSTQATVNEILDHEADNPTEFEPNEIDAALQDPKNRRGI